MNRGEKMRKRTPPRISTAILLFVAATMFCGAAVAQQFAGQVKKPIDESISIRQDAQRETEKWSEEKSALESEFDNLTGAKERLSAEVEQLTERVSSMEQSVESLNLQIRSMEKLSEDLAPFLEKVYGKLAALIEEPPPFLIGERTARLEDLRQTLDDPGVAMGEKFRKVMEALFVEAEYGNTVETCQEKIRIGREEVLATVFRLGTMALFFETLDRQRAGYFDLSENQWASLPANANRDIRAAVEIASKMRPAEVVSLPLGRIVVE